MAEVIFIVLKSDASNQLSLGRYTEVFVPLKVKFSFEILLEFRARSTDDAILFMIANFFEHCQIF